MSGDSNHLKALIISLFKFSILIVFFLLIFISSSSMKIVNEFKKANIKMMEHIIHQSIETEKRFFIEEFLSGSNEAIKMRLTRSLKKLDLEDFKFNIQKGNTPLHCTSDCFHLKHSIEISSDESLEFDIVFTPYQLNTHKSINSLLKNSFLLIALLIIFIIYMSTVIYNKVILTLIDKTIQKEEDRYRYNLNRQISHDIRSPLEALRAVTKNIATLDSTTKSLLNTSIARISDIANGLLKEEKKRNKGDSITNIRILLKDIISDKTFERKVAIQFNPNTSYLDCFTQISETNLYRCISNILNNSIEAQDSKESHIAVYLESNKSLITIRIEDKGVGMSEKLIEKVLNGGLTTKNKGHGLGLSYAKNFIEKNGGFFEIESLEGKGTIATIKLSKVPSPEYFQQDLILQKNRIICIDDDDSFLELYKEKFGEMNLEVKYLKSVLEVSDFKHFQFFVDNDLSDKIRGIDYIIDNKISHVSTLVTSMYQDPDIIKKCCLHDIKVLPKQIFNDAKTLKDNCKKYKSRKHHILIDDDEIIHMSWQMEAESKKIKLACFKSVDDFLKASKHFEKNIQIFIDSNLQNDLKGEIESKKIYDLGFKNIILTTGYSKADIEKPAWIKEIVGKRPNFEKYM